jgi:CheY-like chemotaxis protein
MDGLTATRALRERERTRSIDALPCRLPVVALTAHALPADRERCIAAGMDDYVVKPYSSETLASVVARWLMPPRRAQGVSPAGADSMPASNPVSMTEATPQTPASATTGDAATVTPAPRVDTDPIDAQRYAEVLQLMGGAAPELLDRVVEALLTEMQACRQARAAADRLTLSERMHRLKNTAGDIGAQEVYARAARCERDLAQERRPLPDMTLLSAACDAAVQSLQARRDAMRRRDKP